MIGKDMTDSPQEKTRFEDDDWRLTEDEQRELLRLARKRVPVLQKIAAINIAESNRLREEYEREVGRRRRWWLFG
jgi:hypothetical protein